ncbi:MAG: response regulator, partial [Caldimonas sp.]
AAPAAGARRALAAEPLATAVAMAAGVLMHRYSMSRAAALERLQAIAAAEQRALPDQAERILAAVEELALPGAALPRD